MARQTPVVPFAMTDNAADRFEEEWFAILDDYVRSRQRGDAIRCADLLERHERLRRLAPSLDLLERLAASRMAASATPCDSTLSVEWGKGRTSEPLSADRVVFRSIDFGSYELLDELGRGGMGVVYKARQKGLDRVVALKMILTSRLGGRDAVERFLHEARAAATLQHPHIVAIHEYGEHLGQPFFTMEHINGPSLAEVVERGPLQIHTACEYVRKLALAVDYLHDQGIVHRDLKPSNVLLDERGEPLLTDFGLAKLYRHEAGITRTGDIAGTASYMPPEQALGKNSRVGPVSDVYSLGAILYELLTGRPPFRASTPLETLVEVVEGEPPALHTLNSAVPADLECICLRCLQKDPDDRYPSAGALARDLERFLVGEPVEARPANLRQRFWRWARREPALASHLAVYAIFAAIIVGYDLVAAEPIHRRVFATVLPIMGVAALLAIVLQRLLQEARWAAWPRMLWITTDVILFTAAVAAAQGPPASLVVGYPMLIAAAGLWFRERLVLAMTVQCVIAYAVLMAWKGLGDQPAHYPLIYVTGLLVLGCMTAYQVRRVRVLSKFYESRNLP